MIKKQNDLTLRLFNLKKPTLKININIDSTKAKKEFGWKQKITLEKGIKKTINWYKENYL